MLGLVSWKTFLAFDFLFALAKEIVISILQLFDRILQCLTSYFFEPRKFFLEFWNLYRINDPTFYPVAVKPKINLGGGGKNFYKIENNYEYYKIKSKEIFWMEFLEGNHHSHDVVEAQLRMGDIDKFGDVDLMESIMTLYENKEWALSKSLPDLYVFPLFGAPNIDYTIKDPEQLMQIAICWQIDDFKDDQNPPSAVRLLYFSIDDINKGKKLREDLSKKISPPVKQILHEL